MIKLKLRAIAGRTARLSGIDNPVRRSLSRKHGGYILAYHEISEKQFFNQIDALHPDRAISLTEMVERIRNGKPTGGTFSVTVDDGKRNGFENICKSSLNNELPVTFYLPTKFINHKILPFMILQNLRENMQPSRIHFNSQKLDLSNARNQEVFFYQLQHKLYSVSEPEFMEELDPLIENLVDGGHITEHEVYRTPEPVTWDMVEHYNRYDHIDFQSHGVTHQPLSALDEQDLVFELETSKREIFEHTGREVNHFCYPYGGDASIGQAAPKIVRRFYSSAVTMNRGRIRGSDLMLLPRIPIYERDTADVVRLKTIVL